MKTDEIIAEFNQAKARRDLLDKQCREKEEKLAVLSVGVEDMVKARWVLTEVSQITQQRFKERVETLITMAIQAVFDRPFVFHLVFERKRNKIECSPVVTEIVNGQERIYEEPKNDMGGGIIDIISFAFRVVLWSLEKPSSRNVIILDEPMKNMGALVGLGGQVLKEISHKVGFQLIIITHDDELIEIGDRVYHVTHDGDQSSVRLEKGEPANVQKKGTRIRRDL